MISADLRGLNKISSKFGLIWGYFYCHFIGAGAPLKKSHICVIIGKIIEFQIVVIHLYMVFVTIQKAFRAC